MSVPSRATTLPGPSWLPSPTQMMEIIFNATPRVLLNERLHEAPRLLPVSDLRGYPGGRETGTGVRVFPEPQLESFCPLFQREPSATHRQNRPTLHPVASWLPYWSFSICASLPAAWVPSSSLTPFFSLDLTQTSGCCTPTLHVRSSRWFRSICPKLSF